MILYCTVCLYICTYSCTVISVIPDETEFVLFLSDGELDYSVTNLSGQLVLFQFGAGPKVIK